MALDGDMTLSPISDSYFLS